MAALATTQFYGTTRQRPRRSERAVVRTETAEQILEAIAANDASDLELSESENEGDAVDPGMEAEDNDPDDDEVSESEDHESDECPTWRRSRRLCTTWIPVYQPTADTLDIRKQWTPLQYFEQYIDQGMLDAMADATNFTSVMVTGKSLNTTGQELRKFFGVTIWMSCLGFKRIRMYWEKETRVPIISSSITRQRYFELRSRLKVVKDIEISPDERKKDRLWKIRPLLARVLQGCHSLPRELCLSIDEQMVPFTGRTSLRQYVPRKPNPEGLKNFVLASPAGLIMDFEIYQGKGTFPDGAQKSLGVRGSAVMRLVETVPPGTDLYFDRYFTSPSLLDELAAKGIAGTGTVMKNRIPKGLKLASKKDLKVKGRGTSEQWTKSDGRMCVVQWYDNKPIILMSSVHQKDPEDECRRWSSSSMEHIAVKRPAIVSKYNQSMGGVDMADRVISYYRISSRVNKWTIRTMFHLFDISLSNAWIQYR
ncbi:piggyBac transposable element-derived protein 3-like [Ornithodoros turicata]|uniref:piggyBac transposable element-derived protein 3-like n=1 Tax=Ornithodoros turicata TaxID=34597 RepID=UPI00313A4B9D